MASKGAKLECVLILAITKEAVFVKCSFMSTVIPPGHLQLCTPGYQQLWFRLSPEGQHPSALSLPLLSAVCVSVCVV